MAVHAFLISGLIALIGFTMVPLAPPRFMPEFGFTDTIVHTQSYYAFQNPKIVNQYAAMPSLHFGWDLLIAIAIGYNTRDRWGRVLAAVSLLGLTIAVLLRRSLRREGRLSFLT